MSATQELIAAALTAADKMDEMAMSFCSSIHPNSDDLREACARAMVKPASPDMAEFNKLVREFEYAAGPYGHDLRCIASRSALLDYVRGVLAERDQFRDAAKMVPAASDPDPLHLSRILHELAGAASMCWTPKPSTAVFDSSQALVFVEQAIAEIRQRMQMVSAAPQPVSAAEVPTPDIAGELFDGTKVCYESNVRTYGDAREAAGYAAGVAAVRDYAVMRWCAEVSNRPLVNTHRRTLDDTWRQVIRHTGGDPETLIGPCHDALVALRGEAG